MPHVGGGGCSGGGFHSSGGSHTSSTPRYDHHGNLHSPYYVRPGFYYHHRYIAYTLKERHSAKPYFASIFMFIFAAFMALFAVLSFTSKGKYNEDRLEEYAFNQYFETYNVNDSKFENNILVTFISYEDETQFDYVSIVGNNVDYATDEIFGNDKSFFGKSLIKNIPHENYYDDLYKYLSDSLKDLNTEFETNPIYGNVHLGIGSADQVNIINKTNFGEPNGKTELLNECNNFYSLRGYNISFLIADAEKVYTVEWPAVIILIVFAVLCTGIGIGSLITIKKDTKFIENEIKNGNASKYFEGEDPFEEYYKNNPID